VGIQFYSSFKKNSKKKALKLVEPSDSITESASGNIEASPSSERGVRMVPPHKSHEVAKFEQHLRKEIEQKTQTEELLKRERLKKF